MTPLCTLETVRLVRLRAFHRKSLREETSSNFIMVTLHIMVTSEVAFPEVGQLSLSSLRSESDPTQIGRCCENTNSPHWLHFTTQMYFLQDSSMDKYTRNWNHTHDTGRQQEQLQEILFSPAT